jgi:hypothetical protein
MNAQSTHLKNSLHLQGHPGGFTEFFCAECIYMP